MPWERPSGKICYAHAVLLAKYQVGHNSTSGGGDEKVSGGTSEVFLEKYAGEYDFDYLMLRPRAIRNRCWTSKQKNPSGAVGINAGYPGHSGQACINIPTWVRLIRQYSCRPGRAGCGNIDDTDFNRSEDRNSANKTLFVFASYNAGPNRIVRLRKQAADMGLDPRNVWFGNVERLRPKTLGRRRSLTFPDIIPRILTSLTSWRSSSGRLGRKRRDAAS